MLEDLNLGDVMSLALRMHVSDTKRKMHLLNKNSVEEKLGMEATVTVPVASSAHAVKESIYDNIEYYIEMG